ncbi:MAG TPA: hypothetical protein VD833_01490 [Vicinamibacterales bacterium]|nr:hypothetical protein [Vicinamibacterales bacterium]
MQKLIGTLVTVVAVAGVAAGAQEVERRSTTKITVEDGRDVRLTGCVERSARDGFVLTRAAGKEGPSASYILVGEDADDLEDHVGHRVEVKGKAADKGSGKVKIRSESEVESAGGDTRKRESRTEVEGDLDGLPFLGVESIRTLATVCR